MWYTGVISEWRSIRPVEINQYDITMVIHYDITMGIPSNVITITMGNDIARDIHCDVTMSNDVAMCIYHAITMHNDVAMNLFYNVFSALYLIMILLWVVWNKKKNKFMFDRSAWVGEHIHIPTQTQLMCFPQTDQTLICYNKHARCKVLSFLINTLIKIFIQLVYLWPNFYNLKLSRKLKKDYYQKTIIFINHSILSTILWTEKLEPMPNHQFCLYCHSGYLTGLSPLTYSRFVRQSEFTDNQIYVCPDQEDGPCNCHLMPPQTWLSAS